MTINCFENRQKFKTLSGDIGRAKVTRRERKLISDGKRSHVTLEFTNRPDEVHHINALVLIESAIAEDEWELGDYVEDKCLNCGRYRLCECDNGKHRCEKCNWIPEDNEYHSG